MADEKHKYLTRRALLIWACAIVTVAVLRATSPEVLSSVTGAGATVITAVVGILATVIGFYQ